jgi:hypothetical protein
MAPNPLQNRADSKTVVLEALARLRVAFPLEQRLRDAAPVVRATYAQVLAHWLRAMPPSTCALNTDALSALVQLDAVVEDEYGLGCYPFSTHNTGIRVTLPNGSVHAMCAIDALAIARLARVHTEIDANCASCGSTVAIHVEENGGLDHEQAEAARVIWRHTGDAHTSASLGLCRQIRFLCNACPVPEVSEHFSLPQAAAIGNAFFGFQSALLAAHALSAAKL